MINVLPIPLYMLIHSAMYEAPLHDSPYDNAFDSAELLKRVRVDVADEIKVNRDGVEKKARAILFYDVINSSGLQSSDFEEGGRITFEGRTYFIHSIERLYTTRLHHFEIGLV